MPCHNGWISLLHATNILLACDTIAYNKQNKKPAPGHHWSLNPLDNSLRQCSLFTLAGISWQCCVQRGQENFHLHRKTIAKFRLARPKELKYIIYKYYSEKWSGEVIYKWTVIEHFLPFICIFYGFSMDFFPSFSALCRCYAKNTFLLQFIVLVWDFFSELISEIYGTNKTFLVILFRSNIYFV